MVRMSKGETRPLTERSNWQCVNPDKLKRTAPSPQLRGSGGPARPGLCAALWGRGLDRVSGIAAMYSLKTIFIFLPRIFFGDRRLMKQHTKKRLERDIKRDELFLLLDHYLIYREKQNEHVLNGTYEEFEQRLIEWSES